MSEQPPLSATLPDGEEEYILLCAIIVICVIRAPPSPLVFPGRGVEI